VSIFRKVVKSLLSFADVKALGADDEFADDRRYVLSDPYRCHAWVNIAVNILARNIARARFCINRAGEEVVNGPLFDLFRRPNENMSRFDMWKETTGWWAMEGEAFWWFGSRYSGGVPREIYILNPRNMRHEALHSGNGLPDCRGAGKQCRWFFESGMGLVPILGDELIHFRDFNPWDAVRGVNPLVALSMELEQDYYANRANSHLLRNNAIPQGLLKTDQAIRPEEADAIERRWLNKYGSENNNRKIAVLGKGTEFQAINISPEAMRFLDLKKWNLYTILARYGIPPRVANINDKTTSLSGQDSKQQHAAFWQYTLIPLLKQYESILESQFFARFGLKEEGSFYLGDIPELQENETEQSKRDIAEIRAGLKTINDVLRERGREPKPWGDIWFREKNLIPFDGSNGGEKP
jgi:HK97 family phage portal protein